MVCPKYNIREGNKFKCPANAMIKSLEYRTTGTEPNLEFPYKEYFNRSEKDPTTNLMLKELGLTPRDAVRLAGHVICNEYCYGDYEACPAYC